MRVKGLVDYSNKLAEIVTKLDSENKELKKKVEEYREESASQDDLTE